MTSWHIFTYLNKSSFLIFIHSKLECTAQAQAPLAHTVIRSWGSSSSAQNQELTVPGNLGAAAAYHQGSCMAFLKVPEKGQLVILWLEGEAKRKPGNIAGCFPNLSTHISYMLAETRWNFKETTSVQHLGIILFQEMNYLGKCYTGSNIGEQFWLALLQESPVVTKE